MQLRSNRLVVLATLTLWTVLFSVNKVRANPSGEAVVAGAATFQRGTGNLQITTSDRAIINWQNFSIGHGEVTSFLQPSASSAVLNRVISGNPSSLLGGLQSNGRVFLINPNGILVGAGARIDTAGFLASTLDTSDSSFLSGCNLNFVGNSSASVVNHGTINAAGGDIFLIARQVENHGALSAPNGTVGLAVGTEVLITQAGEERVFVQLPNATSVNGDGVVNSGVIEAATAELKAHGNIYALAINNSGTIRATGATTRDGRVLLTAPGGNILNAGEISATRGESGGDALVAGSKILNTGTIHADGSAKGGLVRLEGRDRVTLAPGSVSSARAGTFGTGGQVLVRSMGDANSSTLFLPGSLIDVRGGATGGDAGFIDVSAAGGVIFGGDFDLRAASGWRGGRILIDPRDAFFENTQSPGTTLVGTTDLDWNPTVISDGNMQRIAFSEYAPPTDLSLNPQSGGSFSGGRFGDGSTIEVQAQRDLEVRDEFDLFNATGSSDVSLILKAGNNLTVKANVIAEGTVVGSPTTGPFQIQMVADADHNGAGDISIQDGALVYTENGGIQLDGVNIFIRGDSTRQTEVRATGANGNVFVPAGRNVFVIPNASSAGRARLAATGRMNLGGNLEVRAGGAGTGSAVSAAALTVSGDISLQGGGTSAGAFLDAFSGGITAANLLVEGGGGVGALAEVEADFINTSGTMTLQAGSGSGADVNVYAGSISATGGFVARSSANAGIFFDRLTDFTAGNILLDASAGNLVRLQHYSSTDLAINAANDFVMRGGPLFSNVGDAAIDHYSPSAQLITITAGRDVVFNSQSYVSVNAGALLVKAGRSIILDDGCGIDVVGNLTFVTDNANAVRPNYDPNTESLFVYNGFYRATGRLLIFGVSRGYMTTDEGLPDVLQYDTYFGEPVGAGSGLVVKFKQDGSAPGGGSPPPPPGGTSQSIDYLNGELSEVTDLPPGYSEPPKNSSWFVDTGGLTWQQLIGKIFSSGKCAWGTAASLTPGDQFENLASLRRFRDQVLKPTEAGQQLSALYYELSPEIIRACATDAAARNFLVSAYPAAVALARALEVDPASQTPLRLEAAAAPATDGLRQLRDLYLTKAGSRQELAALFDRVAPALAQAARADTNAAALLQCANDIALAVIRDQEQAKSLASLRQPGGARRDVDDRELFARFRDRYLMQHPQGRKFAALCARIAPALIVSGAADGKPRSALRDLYDTAVDVARDADEAHTLLAQRKTISPAPPVPEKVTLAANHSP